MDTRSLLAQVVQLAGDNGAHGRPPFAALVALDGDVLGTGVNTTPRDGDPTAHAEVAAIRAACQETGSTDLDGTLLVANCQPCPLCHSAALLTGVVRIVYAAPAEYAAEVGFVLPPRAEVIQTAFTASGIAEHHETPGARDPFTRYALARS